MESFVQMMAQMVIQGKVVVIHTTNWPIYILLSLTVACLVGLTVTGLIKACRRG